MPPVRGFNREDHYLSEGQWHAQRRNIAVGTHDWSTAWSENLILERFYAPVLNHGYRLPEEQRAAIARDAGTNNRVSYVSDAAPYPIYVVRRSVFWGATALIVVAIMVPDPAR